MAAGKIIISLYILFLSSANGLLYSQKAYINTPDNIYELNSDLTTCSYTALNNLCGWNGAYQSMALFRDTLYYSLFSGDLYRFKLGQPGSCEFLGRNGWGNSMTVDKDGILYMAGGPNLQRYDPHTGQLDDLGTLPFGSSGDLVFYKDKLLLAGFNPLTGVPGIYEINTRNIMNSSLYMKTAGYKFFGILSFPASCGVSKIFGLSPESGETRIVELDLVNKIVGAVSCTLPLNVYDAASGTEAGYDDGAITNLSVIAPCSAANFGAVKVSAFFVSPGIITYKLDNTTTNTTGEFPKVPVGNHTITAISPGGCLINTSFIISPVSTVHVDIQKRDPDDCQTHNGTIVITLPLDGVSVIYTLLNTGTSQSSGSFTNLAGGIYNFHVSTSDGCSADTSILLIEKDRSTCSDVFVPNAFTPNNDGKNDLFKPVYSYFIRNITMQIFDRRGQKIYEGNGLGFSWDGTYKGIKEGSGVFVYIIRYTGYNGLSKFLKGTVTLIR